MKKGKGALLIAAVLLVGIKSCSEKDGTSRLIVKLVDQPASYTEVNVDIQGVSVHVSETAIETDGGWTDLAGSNVGVKNILDYTGGNELTLADVNIPAGKISQIRLKLGEDNTLVINGNDIKPLETPSGQQSGLKLQVHETFQEGITYEFKLDFEAARSVVHTGSDKYILKPVIRVYTEAKTGGIKGTILAVDVPVTVEVLKSAADTEAVATTIINPGDTKFFVSGIREEGMYVVRLSTESGYQDYMIMDVEVKIGETTDMEEVELVAISDPE